MTQSNTPSPSNVGLPVDQPKAAAKTNPLIQQASAPRLTENTVPVPPPSQGRRKLRQLQTAAVSAMLALGLISAIQLFDLRAQLASAPNITAQYAHLATVQTNLVEAGNFAALRSLGDSSADIEGRLDQASAELVQAAAQRPADREILAQIGSVASNYGALLVRAQSSTNPVQALAKADAVLDNQILPKLESLRAALKSESTQRSWSFNSLVLLAAAVAAAGVLIWSSVQLARRTHRLVNPGLVVALIITAVLGAISASAISEAYSADAASRGTKFKQVSALADGELVLGELRRSQTRTTLTRALPTNPVKEQKALLTKLSSNATLPTVETKAAVSAHRAVTTAVSKSSWSEATKLLTAAETTATADSFAMTVQTLAAKAITASAQRPTEAANSLVAEAIFLPLLALGGAGLAFWGVSLRLREYR